ncbi:hypothetical protein ACGFZL_14300 [Streptomyces sp. NPDC048182]|uniref:hypothetical protein n=1 Tax=Streptomyces sp. NPDC048182 TaxID=3365507 RepID=UPI0037226B2A
MGFSGELVFGRSERPLTAAPVFGGLRADDEGSVGSWWPRPGGWQTWQFHRTAFPGRPVDVLGAVVDWTGSPACVATVHDSDVARVHGLAPGGNSWSAWLHLETASDILDRPLSELDAGVPADARAALAWARSAGAGADASPATIERTLRSHETFVEDLFATVLDHLGFPEAVDPGTTHRAAAPPT